MKATRKMVADAIECLLTCADRRLLTWEVARDPAIEELAGKAFSAVFVDVTDSDTTPDIYGAAASLLHEGWLPEGWTR